MGFNPRWPAATTRGHEARDRRQDATSPLDGGDRGGGGGDAAHRLRAGRVGA